VLVIVGLELVYRLFSKAEDVLDQGDWEVLGRGTRVDLVEE
jgi:hypothetical protein